MRRGAWGVRMIDLLPWLIVGAPVVGAVVAAIQRRREIIAAVRYIREVESACGEDGFQW